MLSGVAATFMKSEKWYVHVIYGEGRVEDIEIVSVVVVCVCGEG